MLGLVVLTWALAGVSLAESEKVEVLGLPFKITKPDLLPAGLALATLYAVARYYYYAMMLGPSPYRRRRDLLDQFQKRGGKDKRRVPIYWGAVSLESLAWYPHGTALKATSLRDQVEKVFPKFARARVGAMLVESSGPDEEGDSEPGTAILLTVPLRCKLAALAEDLDYTSPVWFTLLSLAYFLRSVAW